MGRVVRLVRFSDCLVRIGGEVAAKIGGECLVMGDDLFVTNVERLNRGIEMGAGNAILIKPNQIGTLTDTIKCINLAHQNGYKCIVSHRSGETTDASISSR